MLQLVLAAPCSGSGKTTAACALLAALTARGLTPCAFKSGPDYIDPMHRRSPAHSTPGTRRGTARQSSRGPWATTTALAA